MVVEIRSGSAAFVSKLSFWKKAKQDLNIENVSTSTSFFFSKMLVVCGKKFSNLIHPRLIMQPIWLLLNLEHFFQLRLMHWGTQSKTLNCTVVKAWIWWSHEQELKSNSLFKIVENHVFKNICGKISQESVERLRNCHPLFCSQLLNICRGPFSSAHQEPKDGINHKFDPCQRIRTANYFKFCLQTQYCFHLCWSWSHLYCANVPKFVIIYLFWMRAVQNCNVLSLSSTNSCSFQAVNLLLEGPYQRQKRSW